MLVACTVSAAPGESLWWDVAAGLVAVALLSAAWFLLRRDTDALILDDEVRALHRIGRKEW
jgi:hypothetical protein